MTPAKYKILVLAAVVCCGGCTSTRYLTDQTSIDRQHDMRNNRAGVNVGDVLINIFSLFLSGALNTPYEVSQSDRAFKRITIVNESTDSLYVNMVTDVLWKGEGYCDIMGLALPAGERQKLLVPYPAAYNIYFRSSNTEEEKLEIRTDANHRIFKLKTGMTSFPSEE